VFRLSNSFPPSRDSRTLVLSAKSVFSEISTTSPKLLSMRRGSSPSEIRRGGAFPLFFSKKANASQSIASAVADVIDPRAQPKLFLLWTGTYTESLFFPFFRCPDLPMIPTMQFLIKTHLVANSPPLGFIPPPLFPAQGAFEAPVLEKGFKVLMPR